MASTKARRVWNNGTIRKAVNPALAAAYADNAGRGQSLEPRRFGLMEALNLATDERLGSRERQTGPWGFNELPRDPHDLGAFGPGNPIRPEAIDPLTAAGRTEPRVWDYPQSWNLPGNNRREVPWQVLRAAASGVDIIRRCIQVRKAHVTALQWSWSVRAQVVQDAYNRDRNRGYEDIASELREKHAAEINRLTARWEKPNPRQKDGSFKGWVKKAMEEIQVIDAAVVYPQLSLGGEVLDLELVDGATIKPLLDYRGSQPAPPHPAYQQEIWGFPRGEWAASVTVDADGNQVIDNAFAASELFYYVSNPRVTSPYGLSAVEQALISARLYLKRQGWMLAEYDDGSTPLTFIETPDDTSNQMTPKQRREWERSVNAELGGQEAARHRMKVGAPGWKIHQLSSADERYKPDFDLYLVKLVAGHFGVTATELGFSETTGLGGSGWQEGQAEVGGRVGLRPDVEALSELINDVSRQFLNAPPELEFTFIDPASENDKDSDGVADAQLKRGTITLNDDRRRLKLPLFSFPEADMPMLVGVGTSGYVFLDGAKQAADDAAAAAVKAQEATAEGATGKLELEQAKLDDGKEAREAEHELQRETRDVEHEFQREQATVEKAAAVEVAAFRKWRRTHPDPRRPFVFKAATPDDWPELAEETPDVVAFGDDWEWVTDLDKMTWLDWNALHPEKPKGPNGRWVKRSGGPLADALKDAAKVTSFSGLPQPENDVIRLRDGSMTRQELDTHAGYLPLGTVPEPGRRGDKVWTRRGVGTYLGPDDSPDVGSTTYWIEGDDDRERWGGMFHASSIRTLNTTGNGPADDGEAWRDGRREVKFPHGWRQRETPAPAATDAPLTSKVNAHSLTRGDMVIAGGKAWHITGTRQLGSTVQITAVDAEGHEHTISRGLNEPVDRVTGGRAGGSLSKAADPGTPHTGAMVALVPTEADAARLAVDGGEPADELHMTLRYLGKGADFGERSQQHLIELVRAYVKQLPTFTAEAFNVAIFNPTGDEPCITLGLGGKDILRAHNAVAAAIEDYGADLPEPHKPFVPHLTLVYTGDVSMVEELVDRVGPIAFDRVRVAFGGVATDIPLSADVTKAVEPGDGGADPKAPTPPPPDRRWPGWEQDLAIAAAASAAILAALAAGLTTTAAEALASGFLHWARAWQPGQPVPDVRGWIQATTDLPETIEHALTQPIVDAWTQGYMVGERSAEAVLAQLEAGVSPRAAVSVSVDWGGWQPGDVAAARKILAADGSMAPFEAMLRDAGVVIKGITGNRLHELARVLADGLERGLGPDKIAKNLLAAIGDKRRAYNIAITETARAVSAATLDTYREADVVATSWMTALDQRVCRICWENEFEAPGVVRVVPIGQRYPSMDYHPPAHPHCFPAGVMVSGPSAIAATARLYEGDLVTVVFASGKELSVTPNHPVLTSNGWVASGDLHEGGEVLRAGDPERVTALLYPDNGQAVARIEDVAASLGETGQVTAMVVPSAAEDFHSDGVPNGHVEMVFAEGHPQFNLIAELGHQCGKVGFEWPEHLPLALDADQLAIWPFGSAGLVGSVQHAGALLDAGPLPAQHHRGGAVAPVDAKLAEHSVDRVAVDAVAVGERLDGLTSQVVLGKPGRGRVASSNASPHATAHGDSSAEEPLPEGLATEAAQGRALADRLAGLVERDRVVKIRRVKWSGHVYNLETVDGWYFADGIIAHNCRCALVPVLDIDGSKEET